MIAKVFFTSSQDLSTNSQADLNGDDVVNTIDLSMVAKEFEKKVYLAKL
jgi:hypothetical protein